MSLDWFADSEKNRRQNQYFVSSLKFIWRGPVKWIPLNSLLLSATCGIFPRSVDRGLIEADIAGDGVAAARLEELRDLLGRYRERHEFLLTADEKLRGKRLVTGPLISGRKRPLS